MEYKTYQQTKVAFDKLRSDNKMIEGIALLDHAQVKFPEYLYDILFDKVINAMLIEDFPLALDIHEQLLANHLCTVIDWSLFDPLRTEPRFQVIEEKSRLIKAKLEATAKMHCQILTPANFDKNINYPLFIALHGDSSNMAAFKAYWQPQCMLEHGYIVLYVQSSQVICSNGFGWVPDYKITQRDIKVAYEQVCNDYRINQQKVLIGGFSGGAIAAIEIAMANTIPIEGFIALCPSIQPDSFCQQAVEQAVSRGVKGVMMEGDEDGEVPAERAMMEQFDLCGLAYYFHLNIGVGHSYPKDLSIQIKRAIDFCSG